MFLQYFQSQLFVHVIFKLCFKINFFHFFNFSSQRKSTANETFSSQPPYQVLILSRFDLNFFLMLLHTMAMKGTPEMSLNLQLGNFFSAATRGGEKSFDFNPQLCCYGQRVFIEGKKISAWNHISGVYSIEGDMKLSYQC